MKHKVCEQGLYEPPRCRKRATLAIIYLRPFGTRVDMMKGEVPVCLRDVTFRCDRHLEMYHGDREEQHIPIAEYIKAMEKRELATALIEAADEHGTIQAPKMVPLAPGQPELHTTMTLRSAARALGVEAETARQLDTDWSD